MADVLAAPPIVYALALVPALLWGFSPVLSKRGMAAGGTSLQASLVVVLVDSTLYLVALAILRGGSAFTGLTLETLGVFLLAGVFGTALGRLATFAGVDRVGASVNSAGVSARPLFATMLAVLFLGEPAALSTAVGVVILVGGLAALALAKGGDIGGWEPYELLFPVGAAVCFAVGNVLRRHGLTTSAVSSLEAVALNEMAALIVLFGYALARGRLGEIRNAPKETWGYFAGSGTITAVALLSLFAAFGHPEGTVAVVDPLAATAPLFTAVFAYFLLGDLERVTRGVVLGAALIVLGVALVTAGPALLSAVGL
ncbi:DMT family transporter [Halolamina salifodinae]|uniref:Drug/metabolite transporter (DMT)-like permease n=1 Tax=Halolamina salifodinae TaxID=1202767 RepID=A0A8T4GTS6_9EURY|nr:DMT family transporter [Halolamina salifodinae]MBP1986256.1 drug/metabolite transporter (DMT)-like permease [Halolamina salifodinae]